MTGYFALLKARVRLRAAYFGLANRRRVRARRRAPGADTCAQRATSLFNSSSNQRVNSWYDSLATFTGTSP